jgi:DNA-binding NtrC family response regulator
MESITTSVSNYFHEESSGMDQSLGNRIGALKDLAQNLIGEVEALGAVKSLDISQGINMHEEVRTYETILIRRALKLTGGNQKKAARLLSLLPSTLNDKMKRYQIHP